MDTLLYLPVWIQNHGSIGVVHQPDRQRDGQLAAAGFVQNPASHARLDHMKFRLGHCSLQPEQQSVVILAGIVDALFVQDHGAGQRAHFQQTVPIDRVARQARHFQPQNDSRASHPHFRDQPLEPFAIRG